MSAATSKQILFITLSNLGDAVLTAPVLKALMNQYPDALIDVVCGASSSILFAGDRRIRKVFIYERRASFSKRLNWLREIRKCHYDVCVDMKRSWQGLLIRAKTKAPFLAIQKYKNRKLRHFEIFQSLWGRQCSLPDASYFEKYDGDIFEEFKFKKDPARKLIVAATGSKSDLKKWPAKNFSLVLDQLILENNADVVLIGDQNDQDTAAHVRAGMTQRCLDICGKTTLLQMIEWINRCDLLISNDSAPVHIARECHRPVLAIFGPTDERKYGPLEGEGVSVRKTLFCAPCEKARCVYHHECLEELSADNVYQKARLMLDGPVLKKGIRFLLVRTDRLGDSVLTLPCAQVLKERFPDAYVALLSRPATQEVGQMSPYIDETMIYDYQADGRHVFPVGYIRFLRQLRKLRPDVVFLFKPTLRTVLACWLCGIPYRVGFDTGPLSMFLTRSVPDKRALGVKHETDYAMELLESFGVRCQDSPMPSFKILEGDALRAMLLMEKCGWRRGEYFCVHTGASCLSKKWPIERFVSLIQKIQYAEPSAQVVIVGSKADQADAAKIITALPPDAAVNVCGVTGIRELASILKRSKYLISNDSGPVHVASAASCKRTYTVFGRNAPGLGPTRWKARGDEHVAIYKDVGCKTCLAHLCSIDFECLKAVSVEDVYDRIYDGQASHSQGSQS